MGGFLRRPKATKAPPLSLPSPPPPPTPLPPPATVDVTGAGEEERKALRRKKGRRQTFITGELVPEVEKKRLLG